MEIRSYQPGDETFQLEIYNEAAKSLPRFVPATIADVTRRVSDKSFEPETRLFAIKDHHPVGYVAWQTNGRIGYPWCRPGDESAREELVARALKSMKHRGLQRIFTAYRTDWTDVCRFFLDHGFSRVREIINFAVELADLRLPATSGQRIMTPLRESDVGAIPALGTGLLKVNSVEALRKHFFENPYVGPESVFVCRSEHDPRQIVAVGIVIEKPPYADPRKVDSNMPCFRLGAFGTEGMTHKRMNGLFSLLAPAGAGFDGTALDMLAHAVQLLRSANVPVIAAQAPSDMPHLVGFYQKYFHRQGSFPIFERGL
jgi:hypothetical protein